MRNDLPETCFATLPGQGNLIILKRGETGYYRSEWDTGDKVKNQEIADFHNRKRGITPAQVEAMQVGSMCGFYVPGANPQFYYNTAYWDDSLALDDFAIIKDPITSRCSSIEGRLYRYQVALKGSFYLELSSMPEALMGKSNDLIILPDLLAGTPLVPVAQRVHEASGTRILSLENGSYDQGKEMNEDYQIIAKVRVGPVEYALGEMDHKIPFFVTWERTPANDGDGPPNYYWGHYFDSREKAVSDFCQRAAEKYKALYPLSKGNDLRPLSAEETKPVPESPWEYGGNWNLYIIADLKTWADNAENPSPLELFSSFEAAKVRFEELRSEDYNSEATEPGPDGQPPARLTLGMESADGRDAFDILCVQQGENYLVTDFSRIDRLRDDPVAMGILSRISKEIGFDYVRFYENDRGQTRLQPKVLFSEWVNLRSASFAPGGIAAKERYPDRKPSIKAQLAAKPVPGDKSPTKAKDREAR